MILKKDLDFTGKKVAVIGGGNTAIDSARTAVRLGAKEVVMLYRRTEEDMPADKVEIKDALEEGVKIRTLVNPTDFVGIGGKLNSICIMKQKLGQFDSSGRRKAVPSGETYVEEFDVVPPSPRRRTPSSSRALSSSMGTVWWQTATPRPPRCPVSS